MKLKEVLRILRVGVGHHRFQEAQENHEIYMNLAMDESKNHSFAKMRVSARLSSRKKVR